MKFGSTHDERMAKRRKFEQSCGKDKFKYKFAWFPVYTTNTHRYIWLERYISYTIFKDSNFFHWKNNFTHHKEEILYY